ncbi:Eco57I restriction-modification methylase domain-containing protein [Amycolatopsis sp. FBCC-B4732]|uniref:Eco57I restriction-modification methylase domain-containing protein n=1 Tax=Amycolatopsis sp. FBCC-B4732 TaxID=3079339 RepID=UPI001FF2DEB9|nr:Eco57I restriction-modification methylase domain-containing protein [Amycolatopsis sp. FBCC-B4732]UOX90347.1 Eco57I restriction-modification methylase domain-containing protein [Amycolatopsis sp. FBCC-B4732]
MSHDVALKIAPVEYGEVFTREWVAQTMLDLVGYTAAKDLVHLRLVEPSCGSGAFLLPAISRLLRSLDRSDGWEDEQALEDAIRAYDLQQSNVEHCQVAAQALLEQHGVDVGRARRLSRLWVQRQDYLLSADVEPNLFVDEVPSSEVDVVIGNPPYIRLEDVADDLTAAYRLRWKTMSGRADIYVGFFERALRSLRPGGRLAFICADRWMRNQYGSALRQFVGQRYSVDCVWTMHDVDAFESVVAAYPAITLLSRRPQGLAVVADTTSSFGEESAAELAAWSMDEQAVPIDEQSASTSGVGYQAYRLPHWFPGDEMWPSGSPARLALIEHLNDNFRSLHDPAGGTRVGIGIATGADKVYVTAEDDLVETDRLLPLAMSADTRTGKFQWSGNYLVNPWDEEGGLVDLSRYPRLEDYYARNIDSLVGRHTAKSKPRQWYRTIDKVNNDLIAKPKLLIQDMRTTINPVWEPGGHYPHHNLYFVVSDQWDLKVLGGILLSRIAQAFIEAYCVRMRGNTLRFQAQYLKRIRLPEFDTLEADVKESLVEAFDARDVEKATEAALRAYKLDRNVLD